MQRAAIYARISQDRAGDGLGVARQLRDCEAEAQRRGWQVAEHYVDDDISAYSGKVRPAYRRMLEDIEQGHRDGVIVWHLDRLHRRPIELEQFANVCLAAGANVATLHGEFNLGNGDGLLIARIMAAVAANESDAKSRRIQRKAQELAERGAPNGGRRSFGFEDDRVTVRKAEARIITELAERFLAGESLTSLTTWLNDTGVPTVAGGTQWRTPTVRGILRSARISGRRESHGEIVATAQWPAIITPAQSDRIRAMLDDPGRRTNRTARRYLLAGLLRCHACDAVLMAHPRSGVRRYVCKTGADFVGCGATYITADRVEELITEAVLYRLDSPELAASIAGHHRSDTTTAALAEQISEDQAQLDDLARIYAERKIGVSEWIQARNVIEGRLNDAKKRLHRESGVADLARYIGQGNELRAQWSDLNLNRQRAIVATVLAHAVIGPGSGGGPFDPSRVRPVWKL